MLRTHTLAGLSAHLQLLGFAPLPPLAVDTLVLCLTKSIQASGSLRPCVCSTGDSWNIAANRLFCLQTGLPAKQDEHAAARGHCAGLASSESPWAPSLSACAGPQASTAPALGAFLPAAEGSPWGTATPQPGPCRGRPWAWGGGRQGAKLQRRWKLALPGPPALSRELQCVRLPEDQTAGLPGGSGRATNGQQAPQPMPGVWSSQEANFRPQDCRGSLLGVQAPLEQGVPH